MEAATPLRNNRKPPRELKDEDLDMSAESSVSGKMTADPDDFETAAAEKEPEHVIFDTDAEQSAVSSMPVSSDDSEEPASADKTEYLVFDVH